MANYTATARSNYVHVDSIGRLRAELARHRIDAQTQIDTDVLDDPNEPDGPGRVMVYDSDGAGWTHPESALEQAEWDAPCSDYMSHARNAVRGDCDRCGHPQHDHTGLLATYHATVFQIVAERLTDGEVAVFMEAGHERLYVVGFAVAINNKFETREVSLDGIYELATELGPNVTVAEY